MINNKIGILTFHHVMNYGAVLQCFALQEVINELCGNCTVIPYECQRLSENDELLKRGSIKPIQIIKWISQGYGNRKKKKSFQDFILTYLKLGDFTAWDDYNHIVVGSDQVWNLTLTGTDYTYFLEGVKCKKIAYAASLGEEEIQIDEQERLLFDIRKFDFVSFREKSTCERMERYGIKSTDVLDPVLLLEEQKWNALADTETLANPQRYILVYCMGKSQEVFSYARVISQTYGLPIIYLNQNLLFTERGFIYKRGVSPRKFLAYIRCAEYIVTNSFHGTAFSIIFEKKFASDISWHGNTNKRILNLLKSFDMEERTIDCLRSQKKGIDSEVDYEHVKKKLCDCRQKSMSYIKKALEVRK